MQVCKPDDLSSTPETHVMERENQALKVVLQSRKKKLWTQRPRLIQLTFFMLDQQHSTSKLSLLFNYEHMAG